VGRTVRAGGINGKECNIVFKINWDDASYHNNSEKKEKGPDTFVFYLNDWNDYNYLITYTVCYYDQNLKEILLGNYRIYNHKIEDQKERKFVFFQIENDILGNNFYIFDSNDQIESLDEMYYSLAQNNSFYQKLYNLGSEYYEKFLKVFRDLTVTTLPEEIKENEGVKYALLRNDGVTKSEDIIVFNRLLKEIDSELNVGNCVSTKKHRNLIFEYLLTILKDNHITEENKSLVFKIVEGCNYNFDLLNDLVRYFLDNLDDGQYQNGIDILLSLLERTNFDQLKSELETFKNKYLEIISTSVKKIKDTLRYSQITAVDSFIHYTSLSTLKFLLYKPDNEKNDSNKSDENKNYPKLRLSNARQMNDPNEGYTLFKFIGIEKNDLPKTDYDTSPFFFASMTQTGSKTNLDDSLPMWKQYGDDAKGINLTYHSEYIKSLIEEGIEIYKVCYNPTNDSLDDEIKSIKSAFDSIKENDDDRNKYFSSALNLIDDIRYLFKDEDYSYENEYRIIKSYEGKEEDIITSETSNSVIPGLYTYIEKELKYSKIKLGPKCDDIDFVAPYIKYVDRNIEVTKSQISYR
jgi:hypothetical protein